MQNHPTNLTLSSSSLNTSPSGNTVVWDFYDYLQIIGSAALLDPVYLTPTRANFNDPPGPYGGECNPRYPDVPAFAAQVMSDLDASCQAELASANDEEETQSSETVLSGIATETGPGYSTDHAELHEETVSASPIFTLAAGSSSSNQNGAALLNPSYITPTRSDVDDLLGPYNGDWNSSHPATVAGTDSAFAAEPDAFASLLSSLLDFPSQIESTNHTDGLRISGLPDAHEQLDFSVVDDDSPSYYNVSHQPRSVENGLKRCLNGFPHREHLSPSYDRSGGYGSTPSDRTFQPFATVDPQSLRLPPSSSMGSLAPLVHTEPNLPFQGENSWSISPYNGHIPPIAANAQVDGSNCDYQGLIGGGINLIDDDRDVEAFNSHPSSTPIIPTSLGMQATFIIPSVQQRLPSTASGYRILGLQRRHRLDTVDGTGASVPALNSTAGRDPALHDPSFHAKPLARVPTILNLTSHDSLDLVRLDTVDGKGITVPALDSPVVCDPALRDTSFRAKPLAWVPTLLNLTSHDSLDPVRHDTVDGTRTSVPVLDNKAGCHPAFRVGSVQAKPLALVPTLLNLTNHDSSVPVYDTGCADFNGEHGQGTFDDPIVIPDLDHEQEQLASAQWNGPTQTQKVEPCQEVQPIDSNIAPKRKRRKSRKADKLQSSAPTDQSVKTRPEVPKDKAASHSKKRKGKTSIKTEPQSTDIIASESLRELSDRPAAGPPLRFIFEKPPQYSPFPSPKLATKELKNSIDHDALEGAIYQFKSEAEGSISTDVDFDLRRYTLGSKATGNEKHAMANIKTEPQSNQVIASESLKERSDTPVAWPPLEFVFERPPIYSPFSSPPSATKKKKNSKKSVGQKKLPVDAKPVDNPVLSTKEYDALEGVINQFKSETEGRPILADLDLDFRTCALASKARWPGVIKAKGIFDELEKTEALKQFEIVSIAVPERVDHIAPSDSVTFKNATKMKQLSWQGDFSVLVKGFREIPGYQLTHAHLTNCRISLNDSVALLVSFRTLVEFEIDKIDVGPGVKKYLGLDGSLKGMHPLDSLVKLTTTITGNPYSLLKHFKWSKLESLTLSVKPRTVKDALFEHQIRIPKLSQCVIISNFNLSKDIKRNFCEGLRYNNLQFVTRGP